MGNKIELITREEILDIIVEILGNVEFTEKEYDDDLLQYGYDSLDFIRFVVIIEDEYNIEIPDDYLLISKLNTVNKIYSILNNND